MSGDDPAITTLKGILAKGNITTPINETCYDFVNNFAAFDIKYTNNFNACVIYPNISRDIDVGGILNTSLTSYAGGIGYQGSQVDLARNITNTTVSFLNNACNKLHCQDQGVGPICRSSSILTSDSLLSEQGVQRCHQAICSKLITLLTSNPDIGGIGVFISYGSQILMALFIAIYIFLTFMRARRANKPIRTSGSFVDACVSFHRTQCWFISTLVIAAFIALDTGAVSIVDLYLLLTISLNGIALLSFTMLCLMYFGQKSKYTFSLTMIAYTLCTLFFFVALSRRTISRVEIDPAWAMCWQDTEVLIHSKAVRAFVINAARIPTSVFAISYAFCTAVMIVLAIGQGSIDWIPIVLVDIWNRAKRKSAITLAVMLALIYVLVLSLQIYLLTLFFGLIDGHAFGFGQVVATTVWIPIIIDYSHDRYFKTKRELGHMGNNNHEMIQSIVNDEMKSSLVHPQFANTEYNSVPNTPSIHYDYVSPLSPSYHDGAYTRLSPDSDMHNQEVQRRLGNERSPSYASQYDYSSKRGVSPDARV